MADLTPAEVKARFPEFDSVDDALVSVAITEAYELTDVKHTATLWCVGHLLALDRERTAKPDGGSGVVTEEKEGGLSRSYKTMSDEGDRCAFFETTPYGRRVLMYEARSPEAVVVAINV